MHKLHKNLYVAGQILPQDIDTLKAEGFTTIINNRPDQEEVGQPSAQHMQELAEQAGLIYIHLPMGNGQPLPPEVVTEFRKIVLDDTQKVLAHCRSGMRSSVIWALGAIAEGEVSLATAIAQGEAAGIPLKNALPLLQSAIPNN